MAKQLSDPGLGEKFYQNKGRMINKDGSFNMVRAGISPSLYHYLIIISKLKISFLITLFFVVINVVFAFIYVGLGVENLGGLMFATPFVKGFLFSMQTFTTVGFGAIYPHDTITGLVSGIEAMIGLLFFAFATGIAYGRFSKPSTSISFGENAVIAPYKDTNAFMFRIVNARPNTLIEMSARVMVAFWVEEDNMPKRKYFSLDLETSQVVFFPMYWTIVHAITDTSPLWGLTQEDLESRQAEFLIHVKGFDETYAQTTNTIFSYRYSELLWGAKFKLNYTLNEEGSVVIDINNVGQTEPANLN
jgi:inward rectifier potassium channel